MVTEDGADLARPYAKMKGPRSTSKWRSVGSSRTKPAKDKEGSLIDHSEFDAHESIGGRMCRRLVEGVPEGIWFLSTLKGEPFSSNRRMG